MTTDKTLLMCAALLATASACFDDPSMSTGSMGGDETSDETSDETGDETGDESDSDDGGTTQASEGEAGEASCGDGVLDPGEACDDGSDNHANAVCTPACALNVCGDGFAFVDGGEACDDGNELDTDACLSSCELASCGDGVVEEGVEACDDGDPTPGDACTASCESAGAVGWSRHYADMVCFPTDVALTYDGFVAVLADCEVPKIFMFTPDGDPMWEVEVDIDQASGLELDSVDNIVVAGVSEDRGKIIKYDQVGKLQWSETFAFAGSSLYDLAITPSDDIVVVGQSFSAGGMSLFSPSGDYQWGATYEGGVLNGVDIDGSGTIMALQGNTGLVIGSSLTGNKLWQEQLAGTANVLSIAAGVDGSIYANTALGGGDEFAVHKFGGQGETWTAVHATPGFLDIAHDLEPLANGGVLAVGLLGNLGQPQEADGLLSWYSPSGVNVLDVEVDGGSGSDLDLLLSVDVRGESGVAAGIRYKGVEIEMWLVQFAL